MLALTPQEQARVEENMGLVGMVLNTYVHTPPPGSVYTMEDLYQIGCVGLCKAVQTDKAGHSAAFSTYASRLIRNEIYDALEYSTRHGNREQITNPAELPHTQLADEFEQHILCGACWTSSTKQKQQQLGRSPRASGRSACWPKAIPTGRLASVSALRPIMLLPGWPRPGNTLPRWLHNEERLLWQNRT